MKTKQLRLLMVSILAILMLHVGVALADTTTEGGVHEGVLVRQTLKIHQDKYDYATDLHFKITQKEPWIFVNGWRIKISDFTNSSSYAYDPHGVQVDVDGANIPYCTWITIKVEFWLTDWNTLRISDVEWTRESSAIKAIPSSGWTLDYPVFDPYSGQWLHKFIITNDDKTDSFIVSGLTFNVSKDWYANLTDISFPPSPYPDFILEPGQSWQTDISNPESLYGGHIYFRYNITDLYDGRDIVSINWADHPITEPVDEPETTSTGFVSGMYEIANVQEKIIFGEGNTPTPAKELPPFQPSINNKLSYDEELRYIKNLTPTLPLPESDIARIIISQAWLSQNDEDVHPGIVKITFPSDWLNKTEVSDNEPIVLLRIPKKMLELDDTNKDPNLITITYPMTMFEFYTNIPAMSKGKESAENIDASTNEKSLLLQPSISKSNLVNTVSAGVLAIEYQERAWYQRNSDYTVIRVTGIVDPYSYSNQGETFRNYNEREIYLNRNGDIGEVISDFTDSGNAYVWVAIYDEGSWVTPWNWLLINVTGTLQPIEYYFYINSGVYDIWLKDTSSGTWYSKSYDDTDNPATYIDWLAGSTEVDSVGGISKSFRTETNPIRDDWTYASGNWYRPKTTFNWHSYSPNQQYVYINAWWDGSDRINTQHVAGSSIT